MKCTRCNWYKNSRKINCIKYFGNSNAEVVFLGEAFGKNEAIKKQPFVGDAGKKLNKLLKVAYLTREEIGIINSQRCYQEGNPTPTKADMNKCFFFTYMDIQKVKPKLVVAMGNSALYQSTGKEGIERYRGRLLWSDKLNCKVLPVFHPASVLYSPDRWDSLVKDFEYIPKAINEEPKEIKHFEFSLIKSVEDFKLIFPLLQSEKELYIDLESTGKDPYKDDITLLQIGSPLGIFVILGKILPKIKEELKELFSTKKWIGQDFAFDAKFLYTKLGIEIENWEHDTCLAEYTLTGFSGNDLTTLTWKYVPEMGGYDEEVEKAGGAHKIKDFEKLTQYAADDIGVLFKIKEEQIKRMKDNNMWFFFKKILMPCNKVLTYMSLRGVKYDLDKLKVADRRYEKKGFKLLTKAMNLEGVKACENHFKRNFNPKSYPMIRWLILEYYKLPVLSNTKKSAPSIGQDEMKVYAEIHNNPYAKIMSEYRSHETFRSNFLSGVVDKLQGNVAHTTYSLHATASSRPNSKRPNLLNLPSKEDSVKECIIARSGYVFLCADFSQIEIRVAACVYDEPVLIKACNSKGDFHSRVTANAFGYDYNYIYDGYVGGNKEITEIRRQGKTITFGILYGMSAEKLAYELRFFDKIKEENPELPDEVIKELATKKAQKFINDYFEGFPNLRRNIEKTKEFVIKHGYVDTYFNFRRRWKFHKEDDYKTQRDAVNHCIQGSAWQLEALALVKINKILKERNLDAHLVLQVYDNLVVETKFSIINEVCEIIHNTMCNINKNFEGLNRVQLKTDVEIGINLKDLQPFDSTKDYSYLNVTG